MVRSSTRDTHEPEQPLCAATEATMAACLDVPCFPRRDVTLASAWELLVGVDGWTGVFELSLRGVLLRHSGHIPTHLGVRRESLEFGGRNTNALAMIKT
ncbi:unnamed protein product [Parnassius apollo]|uniref:(apollo) hypothetical protein n=1 Tax=Parnassius apollo TaxID=110799 RepID=A0A8S3W3W4_PARAO|nr:unnamed protein product [Parnassius apollo]